MREGRRDAHQTRSSRSHDPRQRSIIGRALGAIFEMLTEIFD